MNSFDDLHDEFDRLAGTAPDDGALRTAVTAGITRREKRRRTTALVAVAASVTLVAGGIGITRALTAPAPNSTRPAAPSPVVAVPDVPLPADTQLIRHQLQPVTSPVSATPPEGLTASAWMNMRGRLAVWWYRSDDPSGGTLNGSDLRVAGYVVTDSADDPVRGFDGSGMSVQTVDSEPITVGGHAAVLELAVATTEATDAMGMPATQRISWRLADGRYIRVFVNTPPSQDGTADPSLLAFAESVIEEPTTLIRTIGVGLTLPGLSEDVSTNVPEVGFGTGGSVLLCPEGVDPYVASGSAEGSAGGSASGEGTASSTVPPPDTAAGSASAEPGETAVQVTGDTDNPLERCITAFVIATAALDSNGLPAGTPVTVAGTTVQVDTDSNSARVDLRSGLLAVVAAPPATPLSADDLAALAASIRLSPDVKITSADSGSYSSASGVSSVAEPASSAVVSSSAAVTSQLAQTADPSAFQPQVDVLSDAQHPVDVGTDAGVVEFSVQNTTDGPVLVDGFRLGPDAVTEGDTVAPGVTMSGVQVRVDNLPSDSDSPLSTATFPAMMAPHATVRFRLTFTVDECGGQPADPGFPLSLEYHGDDVGDPGGSFAGGIAVSSYWGDWVPALRAPFCDLSNPPRTTG